MKNQEEKNINRIDYIVRENSTGVANLLKAEGYQASPYIGELIEQTKSWIRQDGKSAIIKLLQVHPEKEAILSAIRTREAFDHFAGCDILNGGECNCKDAFNGKDCGCSRFDGGKCGCQSSFMEDKDREKVLKELSKMSLKELYLNYEKLKQLVKKYPEDEELKAELQLTNQSLKKAINRKEEEEPRPSSKASKQQTTKESNKAVIIGSRELLISTLILGAALLITQFKS